MKGVDLKIREPSIEHECRGALLPETRRAYLTNFSRGEATDNRPLR